MSARMMRKIETEKPTLEFNSITVEPLTPIIGAEIHGVDLSKPLSTEQVAEIRRLIRSLHGESTVILSTHILSEVEATTTHRLTIPGLLPATTYHYRVVTGSARSPDPP